MDSPTPILVQTPEIDDDTPMPVSKFLALQSHSIVDLEVPEVDEIMNKYGHLSEEEWSLWTTDDGHHLICRDLLESSWWIRATSRGTRRVTRSLWLYNTRH